MNSYIKNLSFRGKILCTYFLLIILTIFIFIICYIQGVTSATNHHVEYMKQVNEQKNVNLDIAMGNSNTLNLMHYIDNRSNIILHEKVNELSSDNIFERNNYMKNILRLLATTTPNVKRISIITENGDFYSSISNNQENYSNNISELINRIDWKNRSQKYYTTPYPTKIGDMGYSIVTVICQMFDTGSNGNFAYLLIDLDFGTIGENFNKTINENSTISSFSIFKNSQVIYNSRNAHINLETDLSYNEKTIAFKNMIEIEESEDGYGELEIGGIKCIATVKKNDSTGWYLVHFIPKKILLSNSMNSMVQVMFLCIILLIIACSLSLIFSKHVSSPIKKLSDTMSSARQGNVRLFDEKNTRSDEIGNLIESYNAMGKRINESITKVYIAQLNQKQAELKMLQFQINPHFLYNALNTVTSIARLEEVEEISIIAESLSAMFRYNIKGNDFVTLKDEIIQLQNYLRIQSIRFPNKFNIEYDIPINLENHEMIKFIIQPIVENSIHHGFNKNREKNYLKISAEIHSKNILLISVYDDGCGIDKKKVLKLNQQLSDTKANTILIEDNDSIGLSNVNARLKNFYGNDYGIKVESELGKYTYIKIYVKIKN